MVTMKQALTASEFHYGDCLRAVGPRGGATTRQERWRRNGATKTWKTRAWAFSVPIKHGLRDYSYLTEISAREFHALADCPLDQPQIAVTTTDCRDDSKERLN